MSVYFDKKKKFWRYEFRYQKQRYTKAGFKTKKEAIAVEAERRKELKEAMTVSVRTTTTITEIPTDMDFLELVNLRLDYLQAYESKKYYEDNLTSTKRWIKQWGKLDCTAITSQMVQDYMIKLKNSVSAFTANKELRYLRATFNFGIKKPNEWITINPTTGISFFPIEKKKKRIPPQEDVRRVIMVADADTQDYLWTIALTLGRMTEINQLTWDDIDFANNSVTLYTRKKKGGHLTPRDIPMSTKLQNIFQRRNQNRNRETPYVFWHKYYSRKQGKWVTGRYHDRKRIMKTLCAKAGVEYFRFHPLRHFGASLLEREGVSIKVIQEILGHENRRTTEIYLHSFSGSGKEAMNTLETALQ